tara:strand:- start:723 stop:1013 length:291 start_codon:yes stop_codon:yes gene_type:complete
MFDKEANMLIIEYLNNGLLPFVSFAGITFSEKPTRKQKRKFRKMWRKILRNKSAKFLSSKDLQPQKNEYPSKQLRRKRRIVVLNELIRRVDENNRS